MLKKHLHLLAFALGLPVLMSAQERTLGFEDIELNPNSNYFMFNGNDPADGDTLIVSYDQEEEIKATLHSTVEWGYLSGFEISNVTDETYLGYDVPLAVKPFAGANESDNYAVGFVNVDFMGEDPTATVPIELTFENIPEDYQLEHLYVTNGAIAYNYILSTYPGQDFYFDLIIRAYNDEDFVDSIIVNLADYRESLTYALDEWTLVDVSEFENVNRLTFDLESNDSGEFGINTPAYFGLDEITFVQVEEDEDEDDISVDELNANVLKVYPNPTNGALYFSDAVYQLNLVNKLGQVLIQAESTQEIDLTNLETGIYFLSFELNNGKKVNRTIQKL